MAQDYTQVYNYIIDSIDASGYDEKPHFLEEKLRFLHDTFIAEYGWRIKQTNQLTALSDWLSGLPSACNIAFHNYEIIELCEKWGRLKPNASEARQWQILEQWFPFIAMRIIELWRINKIVSGVK